MIEIEIIHAFKETRQTLGELIQKGKRANILIGQPLRFLRVSGSHFFYFTRPYASDAEFLVCVADGIIWPGPDPAKEFVESVLVRGDIFFMIDKDVVKARGEYDFRSIRREFLAEVGKRKREG